MEKSILINQQRKLGGNLIRNQFYDILSLKKIEVWFLARIYVIINVTL